ncbi:MAG: hypothetical protein KJN60_10275 [Boseongicola sp.]|nr:hypothetical protein [Boseongicola sp.]
MTWPGKRFGGAAIMIALLGIYATMFARTTFDVFDLPLWIGLLEWPITLVLFYAIWAAWQKQSRKAALAVVASMLGFYGVHGHLLFDVPLAFIAVTVAALIILVTLPSAWAQGW